MQQISINQFELCTTLKHDLTACRTATQHSIESPRTNSPTQSVFMMLSRIAPRAIRAARQSISTQAHAYPKIPSLRLYSSDAAPVPAPYLQKLKGSLKDAMRAKDQARLSVLRSIMSANLNASKTAKPIETDLQLVTLLMSMRRTIDQNIAEAKKVGREDIAESESVQGGILQEFINASGLEVLGEEQLRPLITQQIESSVQAGKGGKALFGDVIKNLKQTTEGKVIDNTVMATLIKELVAEQTK